MSLAYYMDVHVPRAITNGLRLTGIQVLTALEDHCERLADPELLSRATEHERVLFTFDQDFLPEAHRRLKLGIPFSGIVFARASAITISGCISDLELIARCLQPEDMRNHVEFLPFAALPSR